MSGLFETKDEKIARLQAKYDQIGAQLQEAETKLADRLAEISVFEREFEARVGFMMDRLARVEKEVEDYLERIRLRREHKVFGAGYTPVEEQFRQRWTKPPPLADEPLPEEPEPEPVPPANLKKLYRTLTKQYHPDLAEDDEDRAFRTAQMTQINEAYAAKDGVTLQKLVRLLEGRQFQQGPEPEPILNKDEQIQKLIDDIYYAQNRLQRIRADLRNLHNRSSVKLSLEARLARRNGRDLLAEMAKEIQRKIERKSVERDMLRSQFNEL